MKKLISKMSFLSEEQQSRIVKDAQEIIKETHGNWNVEKGRELARFYFDYVDKEGFCVNLDDVWKLAGYKRKDAAVKRMLSKDAKLKRGVHFVEVVKSQKKKTKGRPSDVYMLSAWGFAQFASGAMTDEAVVLRDFLMCITIRVKQLSAAVAAGEVEIREPRNCKTSVERALKRIKACEQQKKLTAVMYTLGIKDPQAYAQVNGKTNFVVTGKRKKDLVAELGRQNVPKTRHKKLKSGKMIVPRKNHTQRNVNMRDHMSETQLGATSLLEKASAGKMVQHGDPTRNNLIRSHNATCDNFFTKEALAFIHNSTSDNQERMRLCDARKQEGSLLKDVSSQKSIVRYLSSA